MCSVTAAASCTRMLRGGSQRPPDRAPGPGGRDRARARAKGVETPAARDREVALAREADPRRQFPAGPSARDRKALLAATALAEAQPARPASAAGAAREARVARSFDQ